MLLLCLINNHLPGLLLGFGAKILNRNMWRDLKLIAIGFFFPNHHNMTTIYSWYFFSLCPYRKWKHFLYKCKRSNHFSHLRLKFFFSCINVNELVRQMLTSETWDVYTEIWVAVNNNFTVHTLFRRLIVKKMKLILNVYIIMNYCKIK